MTRRAVLLHGAVCCALLVPSFARAQTGGSDWTTTGFDAQRSYWIRSDPKISLESMRKPGFELVWKTDVNEAARGKAPVTPPVLIDFYIGYRGFRSLAFIGSGANAVLAVDTDLGRPEWRKGFSVPAGATNTSECPGGMTSGVARPTTVAYPSLTGGRGTGRGNPAKSGVGEPFEGAVTLKELANRPQRPTAAPKPASTAVASTRRVAAPSNPFAPRIQWVYALSGDGKLHSLYISNGEEPNDAVTFVPPNAYAKGLVVADGIAYVATTNRCGGVDNGIWAMDLRSSGVKNWKTADNVAGTTGIAVGPDATVYAAAGSQLVALEEGTLRLRSTYNIGKAQFSSSPVVFDFKDKDLIAVTSDDGRLHLLDAAAMERPVATTPAFAGSGFNAGAIATWRDAAGVRWLLVPVSGPLSAAANFKGSITNGGIAAWKVVEQNGVPSLQPGWISRDMISPLTPMIVNGVIFAVSSGEYRADGGSVTPAERTKRSTPAVLYALDSATGSTLWDSGKTLTSFATTGGLAAGGSRVYVATQDGTQYVFGFAIEH
ncbi:MAG TPA: hypothetical protein VES20_25555 [Bryobacteraceae bacterium]|nr:hypothetical protein [Bryobacteraceae bacterium]